METPSTPRWALALALIVLAAGCAESDNGRFVEQRDAATDGDALDAPPDDIPTFPDRDAALDRALGDSAGDAPPTRVCADREVCGNGFDDDCNGMADDGCVCVPGTTQACYLAAPATAGVGVCALGLQRCMGAQEFGRWTACEGAVGPAGEACDGLDNDCDGVADNGCECRAGETRRCYGGEAATRGVGACRDGMQLCFAGPGGVGSRWGECTGDVRPAREACDAVDNDCNGTTDDCCGCMVGASRACYGGPMGTAGVGRCRAGMQTCQSACGGGTSSGWSDCSGQVLPRAELCDGVDDDCNGTVDDGCVCRLGESRPCYDGTMGTRGIGACADGTQTCVAGPGGVGTAWGACAGQRLPTGETCDDADNNCNGAVDETCACRRGQTQTCYAGPTGTAGVGLCRAGSQVCEVSAGVARWGACGGAVLPTTEACDRVDNDCDGMVDEGCACTAGQSRACYEGPMATRGIGACADGMQTCGAGAGGVGTAWGACAGQRLPGAEACGDRVDNDCDGAVDEGCVCTLGQTRACYAGPAGTAGRGVCRAGTQPCTMTAGGLDWGACTGEVLPQAERCDGVDNNCDGTSDEGCACAPGTTESCYTGPTGTSGVGACRAGTRSCAAGAGGVGAMWGACTGQALPGTESCNGADDNCDGRIDEGCACTPGATRPCYGGPMGTAGVGLCRPGSQTCALVGGVPTWGDCAGDVTPVADACGDMRDNDCDGVVDNRCACTVGATQMCYAGPAGTAGVGACRAGSQTCAALPGGGAAFGACTGAVLPGVELCDRVDNNCNGMVDDGCACTPGATQACYSGPMGTSGVGACRAGSQTCVAGAGGVGSSWGACGGQTLPSAELCDRVDNNCNGVVDDGCACAVGATQACYTGPTGTSGVGACRAGSQACMAGAGGVGSSWGACGGQTLPTAETCNGADDNCNGMIDDGVSCAGPTVTCPMARVVPAGTLVILTTTATALAPATYRWEVVSGPPGASYTLGSPTSLSTTFGSVIVGAFTLRFTVTDAMGRTASCTTTVTEQGHGLRVELTWDVGVRPPTTTGRVDLDLHLHNRTAPGWFNDPDDCFFRNRTPRWDVRGSTTDDPSLDIDNVYGFGPENIRVDAPVPTAQTYSVGVNYYEGTMPATATVRIYCGEVLRGTYMRRLSGTGAFNAANDLWRVARVTFRDPSNCDIVPVDNVISTSASLTMP